jgi:hypothetical protein
VGIRRLGIEEAAVLVTVDERPAAGVNTHLNLVTLLSHEVARRGEGFLTVLCSLPAVRGDGQHFVQACLLVARIGERDQVGVGDNLGAEADRMPVRFGLVQQPVSGLNCSVNNALINPAER